MLRIVAIVILAIGIVIGCSVFGWAENFSGTSNYDWSGFHIGANAGYGFNDKDDHPFENGNNASSLAPSCGNSLGAPVCGSGTSNGATGSVMVAGPNLNLNPHLKAHGFLGGGQIGYDYQFAKSGLVGLETDIQYSDIHDNAEISADFNGVLLEKISIEQRLRWLGTVRARLGVLPIDRLLLYLTAGLAYGETHNKAIIEYPPQSFSGSNNEMKAGYAVGGGLEWALGKQVSVKVEYLYYDLGTDKVDVDTVVSSVVSGNVAGSSAHTTRTAIFETRGHIVRTGLNYKF